MAMHEALVQSIEGQLAEAGRLYHRLIIVVGSSGTGKTAALHDVGKSIGVTPINVNLELGSKLLEVTERRRPLHVMPALEEIVAEGSSEVILLDNLEALFDPALQQDPLRCLQLLARHRTVVASWGGTLDGNYLVYAEPGHPEHRRYHVDGFLVVNAETPA